MDWISLVGLLCVVGFPLYRIVGRRKRLREAAQAREAAFMASLRGEFGSPPEAGAALAAEQPAVPTYSPNIAPKGEAAAGEPRTAASVPGKPRPAYLSARQLQVFRLLRDAASARHVFARSYLHWLVGAAAGEKPHRLDFVCCDSHAMPRLVIDLVRDEDVPAVCEFKRERLAAAGIRYLRWDCGSLPGREEIARLLSSIEPRT